MQQAWRLEQADDKGLLSGEHFSVDGTLKARGFSFARQPALKSTAQHPSVDVNNCRWIGTGVLNTPKPSSLGKGHLKSPGL